MTKRRVGWRGALAGAVVACVAFAVAAEFASATTGPGYLLEKPKYSFPTSALNAYSGRYVTTSVAHASKIISAQMFIGLAESGYAAGGISIYSYDKQGQEQSFASALYDFRLVGKNVECDIVTSGGNQILGRLTFTHQGSSRNLVGTIHPPGGGGPYAIVFKYGAAAEPPSSFATTPGPPNPGVVSGPALNESTKPPSAPKSAPGWGTAASFVGRYHVTSASSAGSSTPSTQTQAGIFSLAANTAERLSAPASSAASGELTLLVTHTSGGLLPVGKLTLTYQGKTSTVYLNQLKSSGTTRAASIAQGSFSGPPIGIFNGKYDGHGHLTAQLDIPGVITGTLAVRFTRYSTAT